MRLALFILAAFATLGLIAGFLVAAVVNPAPSEPQDAPVLQEDYGRFFPAPMDIQDIKWVHLVSEPTPAPTPTPAPVTPAPTPVPAPASPPPEPVITADKASLIALANAAFPDDPRMGGHVVWNESLKFDEGEWQGYVYGGVWSETGDCGLMQINWHYHGDKFAAHGWDEADCFIPERNLIIAREIYKGAGCSAWSTC